MQKGDHLVVGRSIYTHHGIFIGNGKVIHYTNNNGVESVSLAEFSQGKRVHIRYYNDSSYSPNERVRRAKRRLGEKNYNLVFNNCEHFATWVATNKHESKQVRNFSTAIALSVVYTTTRRITISGVIRCVGASSAPAVIPLAIGGAVITGIANRFN